jgi:arylsulfatase A-like enzyme
MTTSPTDKPVFHPRPAQILVWAVWFGLVGGTLELAVFLARCLVLDPRNFNVSRHFPWMFPMAGVLVAALPGVVLAAAARLRPSWVSARAALTCLAWFAYLGVLFRAPIATVACLVLAAGLTWRTSAYLARRVEGFDRCARGSIVVALGVLAATAAALSIHARVTNTRAPAGSKNVLLLVLDTVRAGSLSLYGYERATSPNLSRFAARGVRFDRAFATAPWTAPSHAGMFTGRLPHELSVGWDKPLDTRFPTLAAHLAARGYDTAGFVANTTYCSYETGLDRGFARYEDYDVTPHAVWLCSAVVRRSLTFLEKHPTLADALRGGGGRAPSPHRKDAARINGDLLSWLSQRPADRPFFAFVNYYDAHHPYLTPEPDESLSPATDRLLRTWWGLDKSRLAPGEVAAARDAYDDCITYLDRQIGRLLDELDRQGVLRDTLVVITADHGEHLGEHDLFGHGTSLYRAELHVPLVILAPDATPGRVVTEPVSLRDLPATIVAALGIASDSPFPGAPLPLDADAGPRAPVRSEVAAAPEDDPNHGRSPARRGPMTSLAAWGHHYVRDGDGREQLFALDTDPLERRDLAAAPAALPTLLRFRDALATPQIKRQAHPMAN